MIEKEVGMNASEIWDIYPKGLRFGRLMLAKAEQLMVGANGELVTRLRDTTTYAVVNSQGTILRKGGWVNAGKAKVCGE